MPRYIDADALKDVIQQHDYPLADRLNSVDNGMFTLGIFQAIDEQPTISPEEVRGVGCAYCKEDRDGYTMPLEKNAHAWVQYPNKLVIQFGKEIRKCEIKYCPMCGARMKGAEDGTTE